MEFKNLNHEQFIDFLKISIPDFAQNKIDSLDWSKEDALNLSTQAFHRLLPQAELTPDHLLLGIYEKDLYLGWFWVKLNHPALFPSAFIYEFRIFEAYQNQGYGSLALDELALVLKAKGIQDVYLHVFGHREKALRLYRKKGFDVIDLTMRKRL